jgi:hypothetical protein
MLAGADARGRHRDRARIGFRRRDDVGQFGLRQVLAADHHIAKAIDQRDRHEILAGVIREFRIQRRIERHVGEPADNKRIAIGIALRRGLRTHHGAGAGLVLDEKGLS